MLGVCDCPHGLSGFASYSYPKALTNVQIYIGGMRGMDVSRRGDNELFIPIETCIGVMRVCDCPNGLQRFANYSYPKALRYVQICIWGMQSMYVFRRGEDKFFDP